MSDLPALPEDWTSALAVVAHPDDMEYGAASAVAKWTGQGKKIADPLVTSGEAGIQSMAPGVVGPLREAEQRASCASVGVTEVEFAGFADGLVENDLALRESLAAAMRRHRPEVLLTINHHDTWGPGSWNHADHRAVGRALLDASRDACNPHVFADAGPACPSIRFAAVSGSTAPTHGVDVGGFLDAGIASLRCHETYLANLGDHPDPAEMLTQFAQGGGQRMGVDHAALFEMIAL